MGGMSSDMSSMSSSSFSSSSSSMMSSDMSSMMGGMPPMRGMQMPSMPGLSFKEMPDMPPMPAASPAPSHPEYTVTSPPMSPPPEMNHKVNKGDEYKLALNMQQYSPEDITIKLNGQELTVEANAHGEKFKQSHVIPDNINLDEMSSSFSSDGVLVVKAPKK